MHNSVAPTVASINTVGAAFSLLLRGACRNPLPRSCFSSENPRVRHAATAAWQARALPPPNAGSVPNLISISKCLATLYTKSTLHGANDMALQPARRVHEPSGRTHCGLLLPLGSVLPSLPGFCCTGCLQATKQHPSICDEKQAQE